MHPIKFQWISEGDNTMQDYIHKTYPKNARSRGYNGYRITPGHLELDILTNSDGVITILCDKEHFDKLKHYYWCVSFEGKDGYKTPAIRCSINRQKHTLKNMLFPEFTGKRIEHVNNNPLDFRSENIKLQGVVSAKMEHRDSKKTDVPRGIHAIFNKLANGSKTISGYSVGCVGSEVYKYFGISKYKTPEKCLDEAIAYRNSLIIGK